MSSKTKSLYEWVNDSEDDKAEDKSIEQMADELWNKWALNYEDKTYLTKDLFTLAIQDLPKANTVNAELLGGMKELYSLYRQTVKLFNPNEHDAYTVQFHNIIAAAIQKAEQLKQ